jgi:Ca2+/Na+ antiporter
LIILDLGIFSLSAIIGSMLFNTLGVAASAALFTKKPIQIDWWPITRDSIIFSINVSILVAMAWDGVIMWYETCVLVSLYVGYWVLMFQNVKIMKFFKHLVEDRLMWCQRIKNYDIINQRPFEVKPATNTNHAENGDVSPKSPTSAKNRESYKSFDNNAFEGSNTEINTIDFPIKHRGRRQSFDLTRIDEIEEEEFEVWAIPQNVSKFDIFWYFLTWPIRFFLHYTIPNPIKYKKWFVLSFAMCIIWIGSVAYVVFWMIVVIGDTFGIPEAVMGFTLLAFGGCMPEAISAIIVARKGSGQMGVSNALGANSLAVLFSLGLPWFIRTMADGAGFTGAYINIASHGIEFTIMGLLLAIASLYITISAAGYKLRKTVGGILGTCYIVFATFAILVELDILFESTDRC